jgi:hypothetical protein
VGGEKGGGKEKKEKRERKVSAMRISLPFNLSSRSFIPLPRFIRSRRHTPLLDPSLVLFPPYSVEVAHAGFVFTYRFFYSS